MVIKIEPVHRWLIFSLETKDFVNEKGHKFLKELKYRLPEDNFIIEEFKYLLPENRHGFRESKTKIIWTLDFDECIVTFIEMFKKYYSTECYLNQSYTIV